MANDLETKELRRRSTVAGRGVSLAEEDNEALPALLAIAVGVVLIFLLLPKGGVPETAAVAEAESKTPAADSTDEPTVDGSDTADGSAEGSAGAGLAGAPSVATITVAQTSLLLEGTVPEQAVVDELVANAEAVYQPDQVDNQLEIDPELAEPIQILVIGSLTDAVLFDQVSDGFGQLSVAEAEFDQSVVLEESNELEGALNGLEPILFQSGSAVIAAESQIVIDEASQLLLGNSEVALEVGGHTDSQGDDGSNLALSQARSEAVVEVLQGRGVTNDLTPTGFGESRLAEDPDDTPEKLQANRRIEFRIVS